MIHTALGGLPPVDERGPLSAAAGAMLRRARGLSTDLAVLRIKFECRAHGVQLQVVRKPGARLGGRVVVTTSGRGTARLTLANGCNVESGALLRLAAGSELVVGPRSTVRRGVILNVTGRLVLEGDNLISWYSVVHAAGTVTFQPYAGTGEMVTVVDSSHYRDGDDDHWHHRSRVSAIIIGRNAWLASKSVVGAGVVVGASATVAAGSIVTTDVPASTLVAGSPAVVKKIDINRPGNVGA